MKQTKQIKQKWERRKKERYFRNKKKLLFFKNIITNLKYQMINIISYELKDLIYL
jgi:hypothetical protein